MLGRSLARGLAADARSFHKLALPIRDARLRPLTALLSRPSLSSAQSKPATISLIRTYATAQPQRKKVAGARAKPKPAAKKKATSTTAKAKKKPAPKKKKKPAAKKSSRVGRPKKKTPRPLTELEKVRAKVRDLRSKALLQTPKQLPPNAYLVFVTEQSQKGQNAIAQAKQVALEYKNLSASETQHLQNVAERNKRANEETMKNWIAQHTADEVRIANNARKQLNSIAEKPKPKGATNAVVPHKYRLLQDPRKPVKYDTAYIRFSRARWASGDFANTPVGEAGKIVSREWKALSASEAQPYHDETAAEKEKWDREMARLFPTYNKTKPNKQSA